jgi:hypothetical protein
VLEEGEGGEDGEGEEVPEDAEDDAVDADVERLLRDDMVPGVDELHAYHRGVSPPRLAVPLPRRHRRRSRSQPSASGRRPLAVTCPLVISQRTFVSLGWFLRWSSGLGYCRTGPLASQILT